MVITTRDSENSILPLYNISNSDHHQQSISILSPISNNSNLASESSSQQIITNDVEESEVLQKNNLLQSFRALFNNGDILGQQEPIDAYILPRTDAHSVYTLILRDFIFNFLF